VQFLQEHFEILLNGAQCNIICNYWFTFLDEEVLLKKLNMPSLALPIFYTIEI
jgi:hypothetical protein